MKITKIECHVLLVPDYNSAAGSSAQDDIVVVISTDEGIIGIGEVDTNPWVAKAMIEAKGTHNIGQGLTEMLLGQDPLQPEALWEKMYMGSLMTKLLANHVGNCWVAQKKTSLLHMRRYCPTASHIKHNQNHW